MYDNDFDGRQDYSEREITRRSRPTRRFTLVKFHVTSAAVADHYRRTGQELGNEILFYVRRVPKSLRLTLSDNEIAGLLATNSLDLYAVELDRVPTGINEAVTHYLLKFMTA